MHESILAALIIFAAYLIAGIYTTVKDNRLRAKMHNKPVNLQGIKVNVKLKCPVEMCTYHKDEHCTNKKVDLCKARNNYDAYGMYKCFESVPVVDEKV